MEERLPATPPPMADIPRPHWDGFQATSELQIQSTFFGILPREVRDMIYAEFWEVSGPRQHILHKDDGHLTHFPCIIGEDEKDERNEMFGVLWREQQKRQPRSLVVNTEWAERMSSTWQQHWKCEEAMKGAANEGKVTGTLFLTSLLACKRM
ncbi:uncharacterized protein BCR38DRAFT_106959 [Pseudomassariella vexata]|uniref:DUF7730 domain-containing protein n=1 Tax=Pseudomassariella vexata TaxID=1141098 RepID=A0A1Y2EFU5_9PEZI|nr:uncharacterized protein BCR38DRAFT_106959 [Pseudomassariella vexata]ORY70439.1 hypothetical protein BCR38DRAFT_106959 [Pseudomassariella vexata]